MAENEFVVPTVDLSGYINPKSPAEREEVIAQVRDACRQYGFFQIKGHGVPVNTQQQLIQSVRNVMAMPKEKKLALSFLNNDCRRGYEGAGDSLREGDKKPDLKECYFMGRHEDVMEPPGFYGPNVWPDLPEDQFRTPVQQHYDATFDLGKTIWEILVEGLGHSPSVVNNFTKRPMVVMKMIRYPPQDPDMEEQYGIGAHTDFGGVTVLLQQPDREGLEVWHEGKEAWLPVPAIEDVYVINVGDMFSQWSGREYKSAKHRVINKSGKERISCATFWHGDATASNPLNPDDPNQDTVGQRMVKRFVKQYSLPQAMASA